MPCNFCRKKKKNSKAMEREFNIECLDEHNRLRSLHGCQPLVYSAKLAKTAQAFAEKLASSDRLEHSNAEEYGETLVSRYCTRDCSMTGKQAALVWYSEIENYDFNCENQLSCGNFSQVLWKSTKEAGFGIAKTPDNHRIYAVGHYYPPGNYTNEWVENVPSPLDGKIYVPSKEDLGSQDDSEETQKEDESDSVYSLVKETTEAFRDILSTPVSPAYETPTGEFVSPMAKKDNEDGNSFSSDIHEERSISNKALVKARLEIPEEPRLLWSRRSTGVAYDKKGNKMKFVKTIERFLQKDDNGRFSVNDIITTQDLKTLSNMNDIKNFTIKQSGPEKLIYDDLDKFQEDVLRLHNIYRRHHNAKPVTLDKNLSDMAQKWCEKMLKEGRPYHTNEQFQGVPLGEIVCYRNTFFDHISANDLMNVWEEEADDYDYTKEDNDVTQSGRFTQVIWKGTEMIGVGRVRCSNLNKAYIVVFYYPPGNVIGEFRKNLEPRDV